MTTVSKAGTVETPDNHAPDVFRVRGRPQGQRALWGKYTEWVLCLIVDENQAISHSTKQIAITHRFRASRCAS